MNEPNQNTPSDVRRYTFLWISYPGGFFCFEQYEHARSEGITDVCSLQIHFPIWSDLVCTACSMEDKTRIAKLNGNQNPEWWGDFSQLHIQIKQKSQFEFVPRDTSEFKSNQNLNSTLYREIPRYLISSILTVWLKSPQHSGFRLPFKSAFWVSSSKEQAVRLKLNETFVHSN